MRILEIVGEIDSGGVAAVVLNYLSHMDLTDIECDVLAFSMGDGKKQILEEPLKALGCRVLFFPHRNTGYKEHFSRYQKLLKENHYDVVHSHFGIWSTPYLFLAKKAGVPLRIAHSHCSADEFSGIKMTVLKMAKPMLYHSATHLLACGTKAGEYLYGSHPFTLLSNAVDTPRFRFQQETREKHREAFGVDEGTLLVGHVGRFSVEKNQTFLIDAMKALKEKELAIKLVLVGRGADFEMIQTKVNQLGLADSVLLAGVRRDVPELMCAMDAVVLPSFYEGFPVVAVEAQASGLPVLMSDRITGEAKLIDKVTYLSIDNGVGPWVDALSHLVPNTAEERVLASDNVREKGFDITEEAHKLRELYLTSLA